MLDGMIVKLEKIGKFIGNGEDSREESQPLCPWCGNPMDDYARMTNKGVRAQYCCSVCEAKAPAVYMLDETQDACHMAKLIVSCRFLREDGPTNGDQIRAIGSLPDPELAKALMKISGITEKYCKNMQECLEIITRDGDIPEGKCLQCLEKWLGMPAEEL